MSAKLLAWGLVLRKAEQFIAPLPPLPRLLRYVDFFSTLLTSLSLFFSF